MVLDCSEVVEQKGYGTVVGPFGVGALTICGVELFPSGCLPLEIFRWLQGASCSLEAFAHCNLFCLYPQHCSAPSRVLVSAPVCWSPNVIFMMQLHCLQICSECVCIFLDRA